jgi:hypothetical protein
LMDRNYGGVSHAWSVPNIMQPSGRYDFIASILE